MKIRKNINYPRLHQEEEDFPLLDNPKDQIQNLEKWFNDNFSKLNDKQDNITSYVQGRIRKIKAEAIEKHSKIEDPILNQLVVNHSIQDYGEAKNNEAKPERTSSEFTAIIPMKNMDSIKSEFRKQLLNKILFNKFNKNFEANKNSKNNKSQNNFFLQTPKSPIPDFVNNFKCLQYGGLKKQGLDYAEVFKKFNDSLIKHDQNFDFTADEKKALEIESDFLLLEEILLEKYNEISSELTKKKEHLLKLRESIAFSFNTIRRLQAEKEIMVKKLEGMEASLISSNNSHQKNRDNITPVDYLKIERFRAEKLEQEKKLNAVNEKILNDLKKQKTKIIQLDSDLGELNFSKISIKLRLRDVYNRIMKERQDLLVENGLTWIIKSFWFINEKPTLDLFPKILDNSSKDFIIEYSRLDQELTNLTGKLKEKQKEFLKARIKEDSSITSQIYAGGNNASYLVERYGYLQKSITRTHKERLKSEGDRGELMLWDEPIDVKRDSNQFTKKIDRDPGREQKIDNTHDKIDALGKKIRETQSDMENIKTAELNRITKTYQEKNLDLKDFKILEKKFMFLFGKNEGKRVYENSLKVNNFHSQLSHCKGIQ